jgi:HTH-type transcriptional regulator / antitoxin HipB
MYPIKDIDQLGLYLASYRRARGLTLAELGARLGVTGARISQIEQRPGVVKFAQVLAILSALGVSLSLDAHDGMTPAHSLPMSNASNGSGDW